MSNNGLAVRRIDFALTFRRSIFVYKTNFLESRALTLESNNNNNNDAKNETTIPQCFCASIAVPISFAKFC